MYYEVVVDTCNYSLNKTINNRLAAGWEIKGECQVVVCNYNTTFVQTLIKGKRMKKPYFRLALSACIENLEAKVNEVNEQGYELEGRVFLAPETSRSYPKVAQALVLKRSDEIE